jgi:hypothetical protein
VKEASGDAAEEDLGQQQLQRVILCPAFTIPQKITDIFQKLIFLGGFIVSNIFF